jgi:hypothetical protein
MELPCLLRAGLCIVAACYAGRPGWPGPCCARDQQSRPLFKLSLSVVKAALCSVLQVCHQAATWIMQRAYKGATGKKQTIPFKFVLPSGGEAVPTIRYLNLNVCLFWAWWALAPGPGPGTGLACPGTLLSVLHVLLMIQPTKILVSQFKT